MMIPGTYLRKRRVAAGLSLDDVAARVASAPHVAEIDRRAWIDRIERDIATIGPDVRMALRRAYRFDDLVLCRLIDLRNYGTDYAQEPRLCMECACSENDPCVTQVGTCGWSTRYLCTACAPVAALAPAPQHQGAMA